MSIKNSAKKILKKSNNLYTLYYELNFKLRNPQNFSNLLDKEKNIISEIQKNSFYVIPNFIDKEFCEKCINDIDSMLENNKEFVQIYSDLRVFGSEELSENIKKFASHDFLNEFANHYNGSETLNGFTLANRIEFNDLSKKLGSGGGWHRDSIFRQCKAILYLNNVNERNGAYQIIRNSHKLTSILKDNKKANSYFEQVRFSDEQISDLLKKDPKRLQTITGKAGTLILKDCSAIHRGSPLKEGKRYALTNYFFRRKEVTPKLVEHFSPIVAPEKLLNIVN